MERRQLRKAMSPTGWSLVIYYILMNVCVVVTALVELILTMLSALSSGSVETFADLETMMMAAASSAWGYILTAVLGLLILLLWKKPKFWREQIWARGKAMTPGAFLGLLCIFLSSQFVYQFVTIALEMILNSFGLTMMAGLESLSAGGDSLSMFLYMCVVAPISEELLCRGLVQRILMPYGKKLAILGSAFLFGMLHGNLIQTPYAFIVGLVLGYVAAEYSIAWAMLLHMINNLMLGDMLTRLTANMADMTAALILWSILVPAAIGALITMIVRRRQISAWMKANVQTPGYVRCFFTSAGVVTFTVLMLLSMIVTCFMLITPL